MSSLIIFQAEDDDEPQQKGCCEKQDATFGIHEYVRLKSTNEGIE